MDKNIEELIKRVIKEEIGDKVHEEIKLQFAPIRKIVDTIRDENRMSYDQISKQITEDRVKIDKIEVSQAKSEKQNSQIIDNQNNTEEKLVGAVKEEAEKIPGITEKSVERMFDKRSFLKKLVDKFKRK
jgi:hypothetical protein